MTERDWFPEPPGGAREVRTIKLQSEAMRDAEKSLRHLASAAEVEAVAAGRSAETQSASSNAAKPVTSSPAQSEPTPPSTVLKAERDALSLKRAHDYLTRARPTLFHDMRDTRPTADFLAGFEKGYLAAQLALRKGQEKYAAEARKLKLLASDSQP